MRAVMRLLLAVLGVFIPACSSQDNGTAPLPPTMEFYTSHPYSTRNPSR